MKISEKIRLAIRIILIPLWILIFILYLPVWYCQMSWYYFSFTDYHDGYICFLYKMMKKLKLLQ